MFGETQIKLSDKITLNFLNIEEYSHTMLELIEKEICKIWNGDNEEDDLETVKLELQDWFKTKADERLKHGFVSEFICHLYLRYKKYEQHFLFRNLEEKGAKKGFDGLYMTNDIFWLYESKSTLSTTDTKHNHNISLSYNDIKRKIEGTNTTNNPWKNAIIHANNLSIKSDADLVEILKDYSKKYVRKEFHDISNFNIIPSSTIYLAEKWKEINIPELRKDIESLTKLYTAKKINIICINKKSIDGFINFINEEQRINAAIISKKE